MSDLQLDFGAFGTPIDTLSGAADSIRDATGRLAQASKSDLGTHSLDNPTTTSNGGVGSW